MCCPTNGYSRVWSKVWGELVSWWVGHWASEVQTRANHASFSVRWSKTQIHSLNQWKQPDPEPTLCVVSNCNIISKLKTKEFRISIEEVASSPRCPQTRLKLKTISHNYMTQLWAWVALRQVNNLTLFGNGNHCTLSAAPFQTCRQLTVNRVILSIL